VICGAQVASQRYGPWTWRGYGRARRRGCRASEVARLSVGADTPART